MSVALAMYGSRGDVEPLLALTVQVRALGVQLDTLVAGAGECDALVAGSLKLAGGWQ